MTTPKRRGRPPRTLCGLTAADWARALGEDTPAGRDRALRVLRAAVRPTPRELMRVHEATGVEVALLVAELARRAGWEPASRPTPEPPPDLDDQAGLEQLHERGFDVGLGDDHPGLPQLTEVGRKRQRLGRK